MANFLWEKYIAFEKNFIVHSLAGMESDQIEQGVRRQILTEKN